MLKQNNQSFVLALFCTILVNSATVAQAYTIMGNVDSYEKDGLPMFVKAGAIIPMITEMSYIYEKTPEPITLDVYPDKTGPSKYVMYDRETVKGPIKETIFECLEDKTTIEISISASNVAYELWVHVDKEPASVAVDSKPLQTLKDKSGYDGAKQGWYFGPGCFYGSDKIKTVNIKIPKSSKAYLIRITK